MYILKRVLMSLTVGDYAPNFTLPTDTGASLTLFDLRGQKVVVFFYPKDATPGCTTEARSFRDQKPLFDEKNVFILGISKDSLKSHKQFREKEQLNFTLASDEPGTVCETYGVWKEKSMYGKKYFGIERSTFLIDEEGKISAVWRKVSVPGHVEEVLKSID